MTKRYFIKREIPSSPRYKTDIYILEPIGMLIEGYCFQFYNNIDNTRGDYDKWLRYVKYEAIFEDDKEISLDDLIGIIKNNENKKYDTQYRLDKYGNSFCDMFDAF